MASRTLWIGSYPPAGIGTPPGRGEGVFRIELDTGTGALGRPARLVETPAPSFVVPHPRLPVLYATDESDPGRVTALRVRDEGIEPMGTASSGGSYPCHLLVDGDRLYVANYGDGAVGVLRLADDGSFACDVPQVLRHEGSGPDEDRQHGPHAHFVALAPGGHVLVVDLGTDQVRRYTRTREGLQPAGIAATLPPGTGPRHLVFREGARCTAYLTGELDATVHVLVWDPADDTGDVVQTEAALGARLGTAEGVDADGNPLTANAAALAGDPRVSGAVGAGPSPSHLALDGRELLVAVRGTGALSRFTVGEDGLLTHRVALPLPGRTPRHFAIVGDWTVVAEQVPGAVTVLDRWGTVVSSCAVPSAACVQPAR